jgi:hypothetical protein
VGTLDPLTPVRVRAMVPVCVVVNEKKLYPPTLSLPTNSSVTVTGVVVVVVVEVSVVVVGEVGVSLLHAAPTVTTISAAVIASGHHLSGKGDDCPGFCIAAFDKQTHFRSAGWWR